MDRTTREESWIGLCIAAIAVLVYASSLGSAFVWDDNVVITANPALHGDAGDLFSGIDAGRGTDRTPYYRPLALFTFLVELRVFGQTPFPLHMMNVLLHAANAILVYRLVRPLVQDRRAAILAGVLFAVHPINAESVNFLSGGRNTLLASLLVLSAYMLHRKSIQVQRYSLALAGALCLLAALLSKETALGVLPLIGALEVSAFRAGGAYARKRSLIRLVPAALAMALYIFLRQTAMSDADVRLTLFPGLGTRLLANVYIIPRYLLTLLWPPASSPQYVIPEDLHLLALPLIAAWLCILAFICWLLTKGRRPGTLFGLLWFAVFFLPVSGVIAIPSAPLADRYLYVPAIGLWIVIADQMDRLLAYRGSVHAYGVLVAGPVLLILAASSVLANQQWKSDVTLFTRYVERHPEQAFGHHNLGCAYLDKQGDLEAAEREFQKAIALDPYFPRVWTQLGYIELLRGDFEGAARYYTEAILQNPFDAEALLNRADAYDKLGRYRDAVTDYQRFLATPSSELPLARPRAQTRLRELSR